ncbi:ATP-binding protein [Terrimonas alba]|uniref:ATP-binding protein n=1 Tax=Terrimonas alba TaxID=3349636 RepID=UPI0035F38733
MRSDVTFLGTVIRVVGSKVFIELSEALPSSTPIISGKIYKIGQVGSFVKIPMGTLSAFGIVTMVGANPYKTTDEHAEQFPYGNRWLEIQLIGEATGEKDFQRGISVYPTIDDEVHIVTDQDLVLIYATSSPTAIKIGTLASSEDLSAYIDIDKLLTRHGAILGSTGSGKSNTVSAILKAITAGLFPKAKIILIDPHSEYRSALKDYAKVFSLEDETNPLQIPFWGLSYLELALILFDKKQAADSPQDTAVKERIFEYKKEIIDKLKTGALSPEQITVDSPIPFDIKNLWFTLYEEEFAVVNTRGDLSTAVYKTDNQSQPIKGDKSKLLPPEYVPPGLGTSAPFRFKDQKILSSYIHQLGGKVRDNKLSFLFDVDEFDGINKDLGDLLNIWLNHDKPITILDLGGIPFDIMDLVVGLISRILFESMFWGRNIEGIGRQRPVLLVFEEAHSYLPKGGSNQTVSGYASKAVRRICKEGRKYGVGALVISQRPSDLDETILSQCGTFITLRLSNSQDQSIVGAAMPDNLGSLSDLLPSLRTGEAIIVGESVKVPSRVRLPLIVPRPDSGDPEPSEQWKITEPENPNFNLAINNWRKQKIPKT